MSLIAESYRRSQRSVAAYKEAQALRSSEGRLRQVSEYKQLAIDAAGLGAWEFRRGTEEISADDNCRRMFGLQADDPITFDEVVGRIHPDDRATVEFGFRQAMARIDGGVWHEIFRVVWPDGSIHWLASDGRVYFTGEGDERRADRFIGVSMDITERKRIEKSLLASEASLATAQALAHLGSWEVDLATRKGTWSAEMCRIYYRNPASGAPTFEDFLEMVHQDDRRTIVHQMDNIADSAEVFEFESRTNPALGPMRYLSNTIYVTRDATGVPVRMSGTSLDVTQRTIAAESLKRTTGQLSVFIEHAPVALAMFDSAMRYICASRRWLADYGLENRNVAGLSHFELFPEASEQWKEAYRRGMAGEVLRADSESFQRSDGSLQQIRWELHPWRDTSGKVGGIVIFTEDISERKQAEDALRESELHYRRLFDSMDEGFCVIEILFDAQDQANDYRFLEVNASFERQTGMRDAVGRRMREFSPSLEVHWVEFLGKIAVTGEPGRLINEAKEINRTFEISAYRVGEPEQRRVAVVFNDISARIGAETALREQGDLIELAHDTIMVRNAEGMIRFWNRGAEEMYGYSKQEALGRSSHDLLGTVFPQPLAEIEATMLQKGRWEGELLHTTRDGSQIVVASRWAMQRQKDGQTAGVMEIDIDITERKRAEEHIRRLNRVYTVLSDVNQTIVREKDPQAILESACRIAVEKGQFRMAWIGMADATTQELRPIASAGVVNGYLDHVKIDLNDPEIANRPAAQCFFQDEHVLCNDVENELFRPWKAEALNNGYRSIGAFPLRSNGQVIGTFCLYAGELGFFDDDENKVLDEMAMDISFALEVNQNEKIRQKAEKDLRRRTALFEAQVDSSLDGVLVVDGAGHKILQNRRLNDLLKLPEDVFENSDFSEQIDFVTSRIKNPGQFAEKARYLMSHPEEVSRDEIEFLNGSILERYSSPVRDAANNYYGRIWTFRDITERRQLEDQFRQAQKMEAVGQLTGGIAHDFNNLLTVILGCSEVIGEEVQQNPRLSKMAGMISTAAQRGADLTHRMLAFARRQTLQPKTVDINKLLLGMESFLRRTLSAEIDLRVIQGPNNCEANVDPTQLESALLNLCLNSRDAMPSGGTLTIRADHKILDTDYAQHNREVTPGHYLLIEVSDTGSGISQEILSRVFDPFFTTKEIGKGTGLGLSMVYGFVKQSRGHVKIYSEPGLGTSVKIYLPRSVQEGEIAISQKELASGNGGSEVILLVEDDENVREFAKLQLDLLGYRVIEAATGKDALNALRENGGIHLLFTDMVMPGGMNGYELAQEARQLNPTLKVLYCSGYAEDAFIQRGVLSETVELLNKPYTRLELASKIRDILNQN